MSRIGNFFLNKISKSNTVLVPAKMSISYDKKQKSTCKSPQQEQLHLDPMTYKMRYLPHVPVEKRKKQVNYE